MSRLDEARITLIEARERFEELNVQPGVIDVDISLALVERADGSSVESARRLHMALISSGTAWDDDADFWVAQLAASVIDDRLTAALLIGATADRYERSEVAQAVWVVRDNEHTAQMLQSELDSDEFGRCQRAGARRTRAEVLQLTTEALGSFIEHSAGEQRRDADHAPETPQSTSS
jgi:hypothetical protein